VTSTVYLQKSLSGTARLGGLPGCCPPWKT